MLRQIIHPAGAFLMTAGIFTSAALAADDFTELLNKLPPAANTIVMLNAEHIFASDVATREGWKQKYDASYADAPLLLPPAAQHFVLASEMDLSTMKPRWEAAVTRLASDPSMSQIALTVRGQQDTVGSLEAVTTQRGAMIVKFAPRIFGLMQPGSRQAVSRWVRGASATSASPLSPYLKTQAEFPDRVGTEIIMAIDLTDSLNPERIRQAIANSEVLQKNSIDPAAAARAIASIQGVTLGARVTQRTFGVLKVDFAGDATPIAAVGKPLILEVLNEAGASISEFESWTAKAGPRQISIEGELTASGLRRLFSFLELDATSVAAADDASAPSGSQAASADAAASLKYFQAIQRHLNDLRHEEGARSYGTIALWFDKYARRIERLPILGVDKDLVDYGQFVVYRLRDAVDAIRGVGLRSGAQSAGVTGSYYSDYYVFDSAVNYAYNTAASPANVASAQVGAAEAERRAIRQRERAQGSGDARSLMRVITDKTTDIRRQMTERYMIEFTDFPSR
jgi:hypothetical protein